VLLGAGDDGGGSNTVADEQALVERASGFEALDE